MVCRSVWAAGTKGHRPGGLSNEYLILKFRRLEVQDQNVSRVGSGEVSPGSRMVLRCGLTGLEGGGRSSPGRL